MSSRIEDRPIDLAARVKLKPRAHLAEGGAVHLGEAHVDLHLLLGLHREQIDHVWLHFKGSNRGALKVAKRHLLDLTDDLNRAHAPLEDERPTDRPRPDVSLIREERRELTLDRARWEADLNEIGLARLIIVSDEVRLTHLAPN